jgi:hypothetical protein
VPDLDEVDEDIVVYWEIRAGTAQHPVLRARYADVVWDLKKKAIGVPPAIVFARRAIDAYLDGIAAGSYKEPLTNAIQAGRRALELALNIGDAVRTKQARGALLGLFDQSLKPLHIGAWSMAYDAVTESRKKAGLTEEETAHLVAGLERILDECATGGETFDPFGAEAAARRLASYYEGLGKKEEAQRVIRTYGGAFEFISKEANSSLAMAWLGPVHDEFRRRGMKADAERVMNTLVERGKSVASELKQIRIPVEIKEEEIQKIVESLTQGPPLDALLRIARELIPNTSKIKDVLQVMLTKAPLMARIGVTRIVDGRFAAQAGSVEDDPEGRLIMQLAQQIDFYNGLLNQTLDHLRRTSDITADLVVSVLYESPVFTADRRTLIEEGVVAYFAGDHAKAIHVIVPQIEQALRELLSLMGVPTLKAGRNGTYQVKNLNDILREPAIKQALGEDARLYLQTFLADERGQNIRNLVCHGLASPALFNYRLADQVLHAVLTVSLVRAKPTEPPPSSAGQE